MTEDPDKSLPPSEEIARILLVDDDELDRMAVRRALKAADMRVTVTECSTAADAIKAVTDERFACVLLDYLLPGITALELLPQLMPQLGGAPVLVLTSHGDERVAVELMKAGVSDYLAKDQIDGPALKRALAQAISLAEVRRRLDRAERAQKVYLARLRGLVDVSAALYGALSLAERAHVAVSSAHALFGAEETFLGIYDPALQLITRGDGLRDLADSDDSGWHALYESARTARSSRFGVVVEPAAQGALRYSMLLESRDRVVGVLALRVPPVPTAFTALTESLFAQLADMVVIALENARLYEATQRAVAARDAIVAVVSHDLRSPLNAFRLGVELLGGGDEPSPHQPVLVRMNRAVTQMNRLIDDLLDVSRIERGELQVAPAPFAISSLMEDVVAVHGPIAEAADIKLTLPTSRELIAADRYRVMQLVGNLLSNAIKLTPRGGEVSVSIEPREHDIEFTVRDSGPGIALEQRPRVFERYYRQGGKGLGLGLYIAKAIVEAHGGRIWIADAPGGGASFHFTLRRA